MNIKSLKDRPNNVVIVLLIILFLIVFKSILSVHQVGTDNSLFAMFINLIENFGVVVSLIIAIYQLSDSKEIARATFIVELNKTFVENEKFTSLYDKLQACIDKKCELNHEIEDEYPCKLEVSKSDVSNYLTFFESIYILYKKGVIPLEIIDDLFAYRFFLAVHSRIVQEQKLINQPENFINIFKLERKWLDYRVEIGKLSKEELLKAEKSGAKVTDSVYTTRTLKSMVPDEMYKRLIESK